MQDHTQIYKINIYTPLPVSHVFGAHSGSPRIINAGIINNVDYPSDFDQQAKEPSESTSQGGGQFESGRDASAVSGMYTCTCTHTHVHVHAHAHVYSALLLDSSYVLTVIFLVLHCYRNSFFDG